MVSAVDKHHQLVERLCVAPSSVSGEARVAVLKQLEELRRWLAAREAEILQICHTEHDDISHGARGIAQLSQHTARISFGLARRRATRALWLTELPVAARALADARLGTAQADELCLLADRLDPQLVPVIKANEAQLVDELIEMTPAQARRRLRALESDIDDEKTKLEKQRRANRLRFARQSDGSTSTFGSLDPVSAAILRTCIDAKVTELWRRRNAIDDQNAKPPAEVASNERLRAEALVELVRQGHAAGAGERGHAEILVLIDYQTLQGQLAASPTSTLGDGSPIPADVIRHLACEAHIIPVVLGSNGVPLNQGRRTRLATSGQRSALRTMHHTCCVHSCDVPFDYCEIHHIDWWRHDGRTDLDNLAPVCSNHHHLIHDHGWRLSLSPARVGRLVSPIESASTRRSQPPNFMENERTPGWEPAEQARIKPQRPRTKPPFAQEPSRSRLEPRPSIAPTPQRC